MPTDGVGNITNAPLFVDYAGGNLRLQSNSPCINAGLNAYGPGPTDLDGNPRILSGTVDIGAYEFRGPGSVISYAWLQQYGLPTDGSADYADSDADGHSNWLEWHCLTCPTNTLSALRMVSAVPMGTNVSVTWQSVAGLDYFLERSTNLAWPFSSLATHIIAQRDITGSTDIPIVVEASTNLLSASWTALQTPTLTNGSLYLSDPEWTNYPDHALSPKVSPHEQRPCSPCHSNSTALFFRQQEPEGTNVH